jgi:transcriptional regulator with XRE-family HTH domain
MPAVAPALDAKSTATLVALGEAVRARRKALGISAVAAAEAARISRVTLHRIEKGEPSVTAGAYVAVFAALGLEAQLTPRESKPASAEVSRKGWIPARIRLEDYPQLRELAWQVHGTPELTPREALDIYERNWRHVDAKKLSAQERELVEALRVALAPTGV